MTVPAATFELGIGDYDFADVLRIETISALATVYDIGEVLLDNSDGNVPAIAKGDPVLIRLGYAGVGETTCLEGRVTDVRRGRTVRVDVADPAFALREPVVRAWRNPTPAEIATAILEPHGLTLKTDGVELPRRPHWVAHGATGGAVLRSVATAWGLDWSLYYDTIERAIWWGPWGRSPAFARSSSAELLTAPEDFLAWQPAEVGERGSCTLFIARPNLGHSRILAVLDEAFGEGPMVLRVDRVRQVLESGKGSLPGYRTEVEWTRLS